MFCETGSQAPECHFNKVAFTEHLQATTSVLLKVFYQ